MKGQIVKTERSHRWHVVWPTYRKVDGHPHSRKFRSEAEALACAHAVVASGKAVYQDPNADGQEIQIYHCEREGGAMGHITFSKCGVPSYDDMDG